MNINLSKANFFNIDFAWLGVGEIRMLVLAEDGSRWIAHSFKNPNSNIGAYMRTGTLPLRWENFNTGMTVGPSELRTICSAIYAESNIGYTFWRFSDIERVTPATITTDTPVFSMRVAAGSRVGIYPESISVIVTGGNVKLTIHKNATLTGATWAIIGAGIAEGDTAATSMADGEHFITRYVPAGVTNIDLANVYETTDEGYHRLADDSASYVFTLAATKLDGTTVTVGATLNYRELR